jgi:CRISPR-associated protein Cmr6
MAIGLGDETVLETSVKLHRTYGIPYIPGSALKGLAASYARNRIGGEWTKGKQAYEIVFGKMEDAGYITFYDALYVPGSADGRPLRPDVITVHHPDYYGNKKVRDAAGKEALSPPADWDDPNPVPFLSATGDYLMALSTIPGCEPWIESVWKILKLALEHEGIGAKTSSGYGRMLLHE